MSAVFVSGEGDSSEPGQADRAKPPDLVLRCTIDRYDDGTRLRDPLSVDTDHFGASGEILVADTGNNLVSVFSASGKTRQKIGKGAAICAPIGAVFDRRGRIVVSEMDSPILKVLDFKGALAERIDLSRHQEDGEEAINPGRLACDAEGNLHVIDRGNQKVLVLDEKGRLLRKLGGRGHDEGQFRMLQDLAFDDEGACYLTSARETAVHVFDSRGRFLIRFGEHGYSASGFSFPCGIALDEQGRVWVADSLQHEVKVLDSQGGYLFSWGVPGEAEGALNYPVDLTFDSKGSLLILEKGNARVQVFQFAEVPAGK